MSESPAPTAASAPPGAALAPRSGRRVGLLLVTIWVIALCAITYELIIGTLASYLLGNSVWEFSLTIGLFMSSMGLGSFLSRYVRDHLPDRFVLIEILIGLVGGASALALFAAFVYTDVFRVGMVLSATVIGTLGGLELPLLTRIVRRYATLRVALAQVLAWDYIGGLAGALLFPLVLLPSLGLVEAAVAIGMLNVCVALLNIRLFRGDLRHPRRLRLVAWAALVVLGVGFFAGGAATRMLEQRLYQDQIVLSVQSHYQKIVFTRWRDDVRLYLDGNLQFATLDEYRYHEALVHPLMANLRRRDNILILGGGDGLAARDVLRYADVQRIVLVDLDPEITRLGVEFEPLRALNAGALSDPRVHVLNADAYTYLQEGSELFDGIIIDLPDPNNEGLAKLYSVEFYRLVRRRLAHGGLVVTQSTSPYAAPEAFWCIHRTMEAAFCETADPSHGGRGRAPAAAAPSGAGARCPFEVLPYHVQVPTFGDWGFNLAGLPSGEGRSLRVTEVPTRFLSADVQQSMTSFAQDEAERPVDVSHLTDPMILRYYLSGWARGGG